MNIADTRQVGMRGFGWEKARRRSAGHRNEKCWRQRGENGSECNREDNSQEKNETLIRKQGHVPVGTCVVVCSNAVTLPSGRGLLLMGIGGDKKKYLVFC